MSDLSLLIDMGFSQSKAERALSVTGNKGVEPAMEWLLAHADSMDSMASFSENIAGEGEGQQNIPTPVNVEPAEIVAKDEDEVMSIQQLTEEMAAQAKSLKCDECNRRFRTDAEVEFHAVKTGHQSFSESAEEIKPLTEEEKREQMKKIESIIKQRRAEKVEKEKREALEREKNRRKTGQELTHVRQKMQEEEIKLLAESKRREKLEAKMARQKILEDIERDKQARREKFGMGPLTTDAAITTPAPVVQETCTPAPVYDQCRLQIRLMNGECLTQSFASGEELAAVRLYIQLNRTDGTGPFGLMTNFPKRVFNENDMNAPLSALGLVPSAVLIVCKQQ